MWIGTDAVDVVSFSTDGVESVGGECAGCDLGYGDELCHSSESTLMAC